MTDRPPRCLWISDGGSQTGFARATHGLADRLVTQHGWDVEILATNYRGDYFPTPCHLYVPTTLDPKDIYGRSRFVEMLSHEPDVVVMLGDPPILMNHLFGNRRHDPESVLLRYRPIVTYQARDGINAPATWDLLRQMKREDEVLTVSRQVAMSKFGQGQMPGSDLVYHGIDSDLFHPVSRETPLVIDGLKITSKKEAKMFFGYPPDCFLVLRVDANSLRKDYASTWKALVPVMKRHLDVVVHFQCSGSDYEAGVRMPDLFARDLETADRFHLAKDLSTFSGWPIEHLIALYNAADVFVSTSKGDGFGLTLGEAAACGVPIIAQNFSSIPEVVGPGGMLIEPAFTVTAPGGQDHVAADIPAFSEAIEYLYHNEGYRKRYGKAAREHVQATFQWDVEAAKFDKVLREHVAATELVEISA